MNRKLIITADDYGMCDAVNEAIEQCLAAGTVRATCLMVNMPACDAAASLRSKFPHSSIGIHWNVTQGRPLLPASQVPTLVNADGSFQPASVLRRRWLTGKVKLAEIKAELRAQYHRSYELARVPDFWNTHQNFHVFPGLFEGCVVLGQELGIPAMRCHRRITVPRGTTPVRYHVSHPQYWLKGQVIAWWSARVEARGVLMPDGRVYMPGYGGGAARIEEVLARLPWNQVKKAVEFIIHPATTVREELFGGLTESRVVEYQTFRNPKLVERLRQSGVEPVGFEALRPSGNA